MAEGDIFICPICRSTNVVFKTIYIGPQRTILACCKSCNSLGFGFDELGAYYSLGFWKYFTSYAKSKFLDIYLPIFE